LELEKHGLSQFAENARRELEHAKGEVEACLTSGVDESSSMKAMIRERRGRFAAEEALKTAVKAKEYAEQGLQAAMDQIDVLGSGPSEAERAAEIYVAAEERQRLQEAESLLITERRAREAADSLLRAVRSEADTVREESRKRSEELERRLDVELLRSLSRKKEANPNPNPNPNPNWRSLSRKKEDEVQVQLQAEAEVTLHAPIEESAILRLLRSENEGLKADLKDLKKSCVGDRMEQQATFTTRLEQRERHRDDVELEEELAIERESRVLTLTLTLTLIGGIGH